MLMYLSESTVRKDSVPCELSFPERKMVCIGCLEESKEAIAEGSACSKSRVDSKSRAYGVEEAQRI